MNLTDLKKKGFKIVRNWQECNKNTIFLFDSKNQSKFMKPLVDGVKPPKMPKKRKDGIIKWLKTNYFFYLFNFFR